MKATLDKATHKAIEELLEDTISFMCDEHDVSSQMAWIVTEVYAIKKQFELEQLQNSLKLSQE
jgi:hypothetical protein